MDVFAKGAEVVILLKFPDAVSVTKRPFYNCKVQCRKLRNVEVLTYYSFPRVLMKLILLQKHCW